MDVMHASCDAVVNATPPSTSDQAQPTTSTSNDDVASRFRAIAKAIMSSQRMAALGKRDKCVEFVVEATTALQQLPLSTPDAAALFGLSEQLRLAQRCLKMGSTCACSKLLLDAQSTVVALRGADQARKEAAIEIKRMRLRRDAEKRRKKRIQAASKKDRNSNADSSTDVDIAPMDDDVDVCSPRGKGRRRRAVKKDPVIRRCAECGKEFKTNFLLKRHSFVHTGERQFACALCEKRFNQQSHLVLHLRTMHRSLASIAAATTAPTIIAASIEAAKSISTMIAAPRPKNECQLCGKGFERVEDRDAHSRIQHDGAHDVDNWCEMCERVFDSRAQLYEHYTTHPPALRVYQCVVCDRKFDRKDALEDHHVVHTGKHNYRCEQCGASFAHRKSFSRHKIVHTGVKAFVCPGCQKGYTRKDALAYHLKANPACAS